MKALTIAAALAFSTASYAATAITKPTVEQYRAIYSQTDALYRANTLPDLNVFADMLANGWVNAHRQQALERSKAQLAKPEFVWELPYANDWIGCILYNVASTPDIFEKVHFRTFADEPLLNGWISKNEESLSKDPETKEFVEKLKVLPEIAAQCEDLVREQPPEGAHNI